MILKKQKIYEATTDNPALRVYVNRIENRITFRIKTGYNLELLTPETIKLTVSTKNKITRDENCEHVLHLEITEVVLAHCNIANSDYQYDSRVLYTFLPDKSYGQLLDILAKKLIFSKSFNSDLFMY